LAEGKERPTILLFGSAVSALNFIYLLRQGPELRFLFVLAVHGRREFVHKALGRERRQHQRCNRVACNDLRVTLGGFASTVSSISRKD
jgi:hypothetical protein